MNMYGFRINKNDVRVSKDVVAQFKTIAVANISDCMSRASAGGASLRPMHTSGILAGPALTVRTRPGDNLMIHKALDLAMPGDVIVVDAGGDLSNALIGEIMVSYAKSKGVAGFVLNGAIRDLDSIAKGDLPVFAKGVTHRGPYKDGPGEINTMIAIDGMVICPGDLIVGDIDGVLCVPLASIGEIYAAAHAKQMAETITMQQIRDGKLDTSWIDKSLERLGCEVAK